MNATTGNEQLAVLCASLTSSQQFQSQMHAAEAQYAMQRCEKRLVQAVEGHDGRLVRRSGNKLLAYFDGSENALLSAVDIQRRIAGMPPMAGVSLGVKVGVCVGHGSKEARFFEGEESNPAISLSELAHPGQLLLSVPTRAKNMRWDEIVAHKLPDIPLNCGNRKLGVFEIDWRNCHGSELKVTSAPYVAREMRLNLRHEQTEIQLDRNRPMVTLGRLSSCDLPLKDDRCSRIHARIELRGNQFVLIDQSTNGSFVTLEGSKEQRIHRKELALAGRGLISFTGSFHEPGACRVEFRLDDGSH